MYNQDIGKTLAQDMGKAGCYPGQGNWQRTQEVLCHETLGNIALELLSSRALSSILQRKLYPENETLAKAKNSPP